MVLLRSLFILLIFLSSQVSARLVERSDVNIEQLDQLLEFDIALDGTYSLTEFNKIELTKESAKDLFSLYKMHYQSGSESLEVLEAHVETDGKKTEVAKDRIDDKAVTNNGQGFDSTREVAVSFPALKVGSIIYLKTKRKVSKVPVPGHFSFEGHLGSATYEHNSTVVFTSKTPLLHELVDPYKVLSLKETKQKDGTIKVVISQKRPHMRFPIEEYSVLPKEEITGFRVSSEKNLNKVKDYFKSKFEEKINVELPTLAKQWVEEAKVKASLDEQVNALLAHQVDYFNYVGDWRTIEGGYIPRDISKIWDTRQGDCKDFAIVLTQMLRALGLNASPALVKRSSFYEAYQYDDNRSVIGMFGFNHAIVNLNIDGKDYWLDPTNNSSFGLSSRQDIAGKHALVLSDKKESYLQIPMPESSLSTQSIIKEYNFINAEEADIKAEINAIGEAALPFVGLEKKVTKNKIKEAVKRLVANGEETGDVVFKDFDLTKTSYQDIKFEMNYKGIRLGRVAQGERVLDLPQPLLGQTLRFNTDKFIGHLILGQPQQMSRKTYYKGISAVGRFPQGCNINTSWLEASRKYNLTDEGVEVLELINIKEGIVSKSDYKKTDFEKLQIDYSECLMGTSFSYVFGSGKHSTTTANLAKLFMELPINERVEKRKEIARQEVMSTGRKRIASYNEQEVLVLLKMNIEEAPKDAESYVLLSQIITDIGYMNGSRWTSESLSSALNILTIGLQQIPESAALALRLGGVLGMSGQNDAAKKVLTEVQSKYQLKTFQDYHLAHYLAKRVEDKKLAGDYLKMALAVATTDDEKSTATFNLGVLASSSKDLEGCVKYYDETTKVDPNYFWAYLNVVNCHLDMKNYDLAVMAGEKSYALVDRGMSSNNYERALYARAKSKVKESHYDQAIEDLKRAIEVSPKDEDYLLLAKCYAFKSDLKAALDSIETGTNYLKKNNRKYYTEAANILKSSDEQYLLYMNKAADATKTVASKMWVYYNIIFVMTEKGKFDQIKDYATQSLKIGEAHLVDYPNDAETLVEMGKVRFFLSKEMDDLKQLELAEQHFQKAVQVKAELKSAQSALGHVQTINNSLGRQPASIWWKAKAQAHELLQKNFDYKLLEW